MRPLRSSLVLLASASMVLSLSTRASPAAQPAAEEAVRSASEPSNTDESAEGDEADEVAEAPGSAAARLAVEAVTTAAPSDVVARSIVVDFKDGTTKEQIDALDKELGVDLEFNSIEGPEDGITIAVGVNDVDGVLEKLRANPIVEAAEPLEIFHVPETDALEAETGEGVPNHMENPSKGFTPNDPDFARQWNLQLIHMPQAWLKSHGKGVIVAVIDTGIAYEDYQDFKQVPDLKGIKFVEGYDFVNKTKHANDDHGHGTHVAGTIAQATNNGEGVAGIAFEATLMPVKVLNHVGSGTSADIADAIRFATDHGAKVINMSLGGGLYSAVMAKAIDYARGKGVTVVCAAGNAARGRVEFPAAYPGAVAVSAVGPDGLLSPYSSYGKELDLAAPGGNKKLGETSGILQNTIDPRDPSKSVYAWYQGTSMATPHVAGVAALLYAAGAKTPDEVERALYAGASKVNGQEWSEQYGHGLLNAEASLAALGKGPLPVPGLPPGDINWNPLWIGAALLALVLLTIGRRARPGYLNVLFKPSFLSTLVMSTVGVIVTRWLIGRFTGAGEQAVELLDLPIPDWDRIVFGRGKLASPLFYSAAIPMVVSLLGVRLTGLRTLVAGLAIGFAGFLLYGGWAGAPALAYLPFTFLARPWLVVNGLICLFIARAMLKKEGVR